MADTPQPAPTPEGGGTPDAEQDSAKGGALAKFLPLIIAAVLMPVAAWVTLEIKSRMDKKGSAPADHAEEQVAEKAEEDSHGGGGHGGGGHGDEKAPKKSKHPSGWRNTKIPIPLTREAVAFKAAEEPDRDKPADFDKYVVLDLKGETRDTAQADKIVVNIANTRGERFAVARLSVIGEHPELIRRMNENRERLIDVAAGTLSSKTLDDIEKPGFRNILRAELVALFNQILGPGTIQEVVITEWITQ